MAKGRLSTPAPTMAVTLWKAAYHHLAFLLELIARQFSTGLSGALQLPSCESVRPLLGARARLASCRVWLVSTDTSNKLKDADIAGKHGMKLKLKWPCLGRRVVVELLYLHGRRQERLDVDDGCH